MTPTTDPAVDFVDFVVIGCQLKLATTSPVSGETSLGVFPSSRAY